MALFATLGQALIAHDACATVVLSRWPAARRTLSLDPPSRDAVRVALWTLAGIALTTPGPPPVPLPISIGGAVIGLALIGLVIARALGRRART